MCMAERIDGNCAISEQLWVKDLLKSRLNRFTMTHGQDSLTVSLTHNYLGVPGQTESAFAGVLVRTVKSILYQLILKRCVISEWLSTMCLEFYLKSHVKGAVISRPNKGVPLQSGYPPSSSFLRTCDMNPSYMIWTPPPLPSHPSPLPPPIPPAARSPSPLQSLQAHLEGAVKSR